MSLRGKVIAITGAASGIGLQLTRLAASRGAKLALADIQPGPLDDIVNEIKCSGVEVVGSRLDVTSHKEVDDWVNATVSHFGTIDGAANLAGVEGGKKMAAMLADVSNEDWDYILSVNLTGLMYCVRAQVRVMQAGASIVNAAGISGLIGRPGICAYSVSKHGVVGLTKTVAKEVGSKGIRVNAVAPGPVDTPMLQRIFQASDSTYLPFTSTYANMPLQRTGQAEEVANLFAFLLSDESSFITGIVCPCDGGIMA
ncbi:uncharacterized protein Z518_09682 [Rhinocladiella mackenziei CBS 650.93]|uniref:Rhinocladiella mackenziei CBS 650.93 unplaced genomic scaffold supercont1.8, whole genome shotgun sequence n=1 Tax=Rhinocladiella mackenziei CBS 650.93 TaxID=1442369 RepID=A0A0D2FF30_9EURO|nr:uncharacterized protein Z518_09682 [Rhinocladiella mackenziei CBS 650.93]KIX00617.1 hypothetical protein Z518_09682 [Rhinocladiella mackenziei CBS 650.93]